MTLTNSVLHARASKNPPFESTAEYMRTYRARLELGYPPIRPPLTIRERRIRDRERRKIWQRKNRAKKKLEG